MYGIELEKDGLKEVIELLIQKKTFLSKDLVIAIDSEIKFSIGKTLANLDLTIQEHRQKLEELEKFAPTKEDASTKKNVESIYTQEAGKIYNIGKIEQATIVNSVSAPGLSSFIFKSLSFLRPPHYFLRAALKKVKAISKNSKPSSIQEIECNLIDALTSSNYIVLLGDAGMGKTTELQWVAHELMDTSQFIPIFKRLKGNKRLNDIPGIGQDIQEQTVLILDGLDEAKNIESMVASIEDFRGQNPDVKILVSCRSNTYKDTLNGFEEFTLGKLGWDDIKKYTEKELGSIGLELVDNWCMRNPGDAIHLLENPFYLVNLCQYIKEKGDRLPDSFGEVFEYLIEKNLDLRLKNISRYGVGNNQNLREACRTSLEKLAFVMECRAGNTISDSDLRNIIRDEEEIEILLGKSSLIELYDEHNWHFVHNNFQEYLAASALSKAKSLTDIQIAVAAGPDHKRLKWSWTNTLAYLLGIWEDSNPIKEALIGWLEQSDIEALVKIGSFEKDKISEAVRERIFKAVFEAFKKDEIVVGFRHYSRQDLAEFGESAGAFRYLMNELRTAKAPIVRSNALVLLRYMKPYYLPPNIREELREELFRQIFKVPDNSGPGRYYAIESVLHLYPKDLAKERAVEIAELFFDSQDSWERTAAYHVIEQNKLQQEFVQHLVTRSKQLEDFEWSRGDKPLTDEDWRVEKCFDGVEDEKTLILFLKRYIDLQDEERGYRKNKYLNILLKKLLAIEFTPEGVDLIFNALKAQFIEWMVRTSTIDSASINGFIESNSLQFPIFRFCVDDKMLSDFPSLACAAIYLNNEGIEHLAGRFQSGHIQRADVENFIRWIANNNEAYLSPLVQRLNESVKEPFETPVVPPRKDYALIEKRKVGAEKALLFNKEKFIAAVEAIFAEFGKDSLEEKEVYSLYKKYPHDDEVHEKYPRPIIQFVNAHHSKERHEVLDFIHLHWDWISINQVKSYLEENKRYIEENPEFGLEAENLEKVQSWCDIQQASLKPEGTFTNGDMLFFWFILYCKFDHYPAAVYLRMISSPMQYEMNENLLDLLLEARALPFDRLKEHLIYVLRSQTLNGYAVYHYLQFIERKGIKEALPLLPHFMEQKIQGSDVRYQAIKTYISLGGDDVYLLKLLKDLVPEPNDLREELLLSYFSQKPNAAFERFAVQKMEHDPDKGTQLIYAKTLFRIGNLAGLKYITDYMMREKKSPFHLSENFNLRFENPEGIPLLLQLFDIAADETVESDFYTNISAAARSALVHLATCQNFKYFHQVREAILEGEHVTHPDAQKEVKYMLKDIEFRYYQKEEVTFEEALEKWRLVGPAR